MLKDTNFADLCTAARKTEQETSENGKQRKRLGKVQHNLNYIISSPDKSENSTSIMKEIKQTYIKHCYKCKLNGNK